MTEECKAEATYTQMCGWQQRGGANAGSKRSIYGHGLTLCGPVCLYKNGHRGFVELNEGHTSAEHVVLTQMT